MFGDESEPGVEVYIGVGIVVIVVSFVVPLKVGGSLNVVSGYVPTNVKDRAKVNSSCDVLVVEYIQIVT